MISYSLIIPLVSSFLITLFLVPYWIRKGKQIGLVWKDMNKFEEVSAIGSAGLMAVLAFIISVLIYVAYRTFILSTTENLTEIISLTTVILFLAGIGFIDDILGWQKGGLSRRSRLLLVALAAIPLVAINAGKSNVFIPFFGSLDLGLLYPLIIIPLGLIGASTTFNFLAGFNGLEASLGAILLSSISIVAFFTGSPWLAIISLSMVSALLAFLIFNWSPAKVFPGDSLTYSVGGLFAAISILGNFEKIAAFFFIPVILEVFLKGRGSFIKQSFGKPKEDGTLSLRYPKIYSLNHLAIFLLTKSGFKATEKRVVLSIICFQILVILVGFLIFRSGIFI